jgi:membrane-bound lytic murein transglycosylase MltF
MTNYKTLIPSIILYIGLSLITYMYGQRNGNLQDQVQLLEAQNSILKDKMSSMIDKTEVDRLVIQAHIEEKIRLQNPSLHQDIVPQISISIIKYADMYNVDPALLIAIASEESDFNPSAKSTAGALGIMQVMPYWSEDLDFVDKPSELKNIDTNIRAGTFIFRAYLDMFHNNRKLALSGL